MPGEERSWMYEGWNDNGCHSDVWVRNTNNFLDHAFNGVSDAEKFGVVCPCSECRNRVRQRREVMSVHLCKRGFMSGYTTWTEHGERPGSLSTSGTVSHKGDGLDDMSGELSTSEEEPNSPNSEEATSCLERDKTKAMELNGPDFDWLQSPVDVKDLYECCCGRQHGKWAIFNVFVDDNEVFAEVKGDRVLSTAAKRRRQEEAERIRKEANESHAAKEYVQNMLEWGRMVQTYYEQIQRFMENVAQHTGMPVPAVPPPMPPPPVPPM